MTVEAASADIVAAEKFVQQLQHITEEGGYYLNKFQYWTDYSVLEKDGFRDLHFLRGKISTCI